MTDELPDRAVRAFEGHDAFERDGRWFEVTTTRFDGRVTAEETDEWAHSYTVEVRAPMLSDAIEGDVGPAVEDGWFDTYELRLEDTGMAVRQDVDFAEYRLLEEAGDAVAVFEFEWGNADHVPGMAKAMTEYVEGTYMEGIVPGYEYRPPVSELLSRARSGAGGDGNSGPMPL
ncbi:DUF5813 family protein [Natronomonas sp. LN261]|jgi:hypothetical protein|uniref:DUF5813 family protein n=1 Tax=Natronomonas sp. LN261 TaxID=2750669 RepID=UPI0015EEA52B|nr:DUF5813 family protein [Natronomonas sp. LN261]